MINTYLTTILERLLNQELRDNLVAQLFGRFWGSRLDPSEQREKLFANLIQLCNEYRSVDSLPPLESVEEDRRNARKGRDYRIKAIRLASLKGIREKRNGVPYGIDLINANGQIRSAILLGKNGACKTSIFAGLEYIFCSEVSEKLLRTEPGRQVPLNEQRSYLDRFGALSSNTECEVILEEGKFSLTQPIWRIEEDFLERARPTTHFISDYDIYEFGKMSDEDLETRLASYLGFGEMVNLLNKLRVLREYDRRIEFNDLKRTRSRKVSLQESLKSKKFEYERRQQELNNLSGRPGSYGQINEEQNDRIRAINSLLSKKISIGIDISSVLSQSAAYKRDYSALKSSLAFNVDRDLIEFLTMGEKLLMHSEDCPFCGSSKLNKAEIERTVKERIGRFRSFMKAQEDVKDSFHALVSALTIAKSELERAVDLLYSDKAVFDALQGMTDLSTHAGQIAQDIMVFLELKSIANIITELQGIDGPSTSEIETAYDLSNRVQAWSEELPSLQEILHSYDERRGRALESTLAALGTSEAVSVAERKARLEADLSNLQADIASVEKSVLDVEVEDQRVVKDIELIEKVRAWISEFFQVLDREKGNLIRNSIEPFKDFINEIITDFWTVEETQQFDVSLDFGSVVSEKETPIERLQFRIRDKKSGMSVRPSDYLNTARYRLLASAVALALAIEARKRTGANVPFVIDDEFFAADISSRSRASVFLGKILEKVSRVTNEFQVVLFTHDELIYQAAWSAFESFYRSRGDSVRGKVMFARLFPPDPKSDLLVVSPLGDSYWSLSFDLADSSALQQRMERRKEAVS